jgi:hypothetical protein
LIHELVCREWIDYEPVRLLKGGARQLELSQDVFNDVLDGDLLPQLCFMLGFR